ncbi:MAG: hypothetical protein IPK87_00095 [Planctomycetes bacterium]|nr:hypothetical protein [Planctomycetota bacterium]
MHSRSDIHELLREGLNVAAIARELGIQERSVRRALLRAGVRFRKPKANPHASECDPGALATLVQLLERFCGLAGEVRSLAERLAEDRLGDLAAQEAHLAARRTRQEAGDCVYYMRLVLEREIRRSAQTRPTS